MTEKEMLPGKNKQIKNNNAKEDKFNYYVEQFDDIRVLKYSLPDFEDLTRGQKKFIYYLSKAALSGRDILWDQNFRYNLLIRKTIEAIINNHSCEDSSPEYVSFILYAKKVFFANGIHHHYSADKFKPGFSEEYFADLVKSVPPESLPLTDEQTPENLVSKLTPVIFDENVFTRKVEQRQGTDIISGSATNFYEGVNQKEIEEFYVQKTDVSDTSPVSHGLNSRVVKVKGVIKEEVYRSGEKYGAAIDKIIGWLEKAINISDSESQKKELQLLIDFYITGDLKKWDEFNIAWVRNTGSRVDYINGFIEVYEDPLGLKATWESVVEYTDVEATRRTEIISANAQWFEDNSPIQRQYAKEKVSGIVAKVVNVAMLGGDCYPASPLGINLPNSNWIRSEVGSKSVTLANITKASELASQTNGFLEEFAAGQEEIDRIRKYETIADALHTDLHECVGHASGKLAPGTDPFALKSYSSALEEARADLFALYFIMDKRMIELGLISDIEAAKASYDAYIRNGLLTQVVRIKYGKNIEEAHMRNRSAISHWVYEKGKKENVIEFFHREGKTYVKIKDYDKLRVLFGELLREIQRIKSEGDFQAGKELIETYGVAIDPTLHSEVLERYTKLNLAPFTGFVNPYLVPVIDTDGEISDVKVEYTDDFLGQMMYYGENYSFLPVP